MINQTRRILNQLNKVKSSTIAFNTTRTTIVTFSSTLNRSFHIQSFQLDNSNPTLNKIRYNYSIECEKLVNEQINHELNASYFYTALATYFAQPTVALPGVSSYFHNQASEERTHAQSLINYQSGRGGKVEFKSICAPPDFAQVFEATDDQLHMATKGFELAIETERMVYDKISHLYHRAEQQKDFALTGYLQKLIDEQVDSLKQLQTLLTKSKRVVNDYWFDQLIASEIVANKSGASDSSSQ